MEYQALLGVFGTTVIADGQSIIVHRMTFSNSFFPGTSIIYEGDSTTVIATINLKAPFNGGTFEISTPFVARNGLAVDTGLNTVSVFFSYGGA